jgi:hypothetical protein
MRNHRFKTHCVCVGCVSERCKAKKIFFLFFATQCVRDVLDPPVSAFSLSLHRHPFLYTLFNSRFTLIINNNNNHLTHKLLKTVVLRINLNLVGALIASKSHTHPSNSQTSRLLTSSLSLGVPVPRPTQCMRDE